MLKIKAASLDVIEVGSGIPVAGAVILFHGFGADCTDLVSLADSVNSPKNIRWYFPNGPHTVEIGPHMTGRAWFPLRLAELEKRGVDFTKVAPEGMDRAVDQALKAVDALRLKNKLEWNQIVIGGFSQGAMIALAVALRAESNPAGITLFSSSLVDEPNLQKNAPARRKTPFFQSHGIQDPMLPMALAERLEQVLVQSGMEGMLLPFRGGHEIPSTVLREWSSWLKGTIFLLRN